MTLKAIITVLVLSVLGITTNTDSALVLQENLLTKSSIIAEAAGDDVGQEMTQDFSLDGLYRLSIREFEGTYYYLAEGYVGDHDKVEVAIIEDVHAILDVQEAIARPCSCHPTNLNRRWAPVNNKWGCQPCLIVIGPPPPPIGISDSFLPLVD